MSSPPDTEAVCRGIGKGTKIRVRIDADYPETPGNDTELVTGKLESCADGMLVIRPNSRRDTLQRISFASVQDVQVSRGESNYAVLGVVAGFFVGLVVAIVVQTNSEPDESLDGLENMVKDVKRGAKTTAFATILGGIIGTFTVRERWESVGGGGQDAAMGPDPRGGFGVTVAFSF